MRIIGLRRRQDYSYYSHFFQFLFVCFSFCLSVPANAGTPLGMLKKLGTLIDTLSVKDLDRRYIDKPEHPWQIIVKGNVNQSDVKMDTYNDYDEMNYTLSPRMKTEPSRYVGLWAGYRGYGLGYTVNTGGDKGSYLTFGATGGSYGVNVRIHRFENNHPDLTVKLVSDEGVENETSRADLLSPVKMRTLIADGYYLFNGKRFSYAAAYDQSVIQKRSAGSLMAGAMYYYSHLNYASDNNAILIELMKRIGRVKTWQGSVGVGYAYNWVPVRGLLVSTMVMPMLTFVNDMKAYGYLTNLFDFDDLDEEDLEDEDWYINNIRITPIRSETRHGGIALNLDARLSLTYNFGRYFVNTYGQFNNFRYHHNDTKGRLNDWFVNASVGIRL